MKYTYVETNFNASTLRMIDVINGIIGEYMGQGFVLTVRQLYYQLVARDYIPNTLNDYKRIAVIVNNAKLAGLIDWDALEDRTRAFSSQARWIDGPHILRAARDSFHMDMWEEQEYRPFVIVEKEALVGVLERVCTKYDMPLLAARGYPSGSVLRAFAVEVLVPALDAGQAVKVFHLGDHDPSGIDMSRDLSDRLTMFCEQGLRVSRIALNLDQVLEQNPPENPAKLTDPRIGDYSSRFGDASWELDALSPKYLSELIERNVKPLIDKDLWKEREDLINETKLKIELAADHFDE